MQGISRPNVELLQKLADEAMEIFDQEQKLKRLQELEQPIIDDDGFVLVGKSSAKRNVGGGASVLTLKKEEAMLLKPKDKSLSDFYRFQTREQKRNSYNFNRFATIEGKV